MGDDPRWQADSMAERKSGNYLSAGWKVGGSVGGSWHVVGFPRRCSGHFLQSKRIKVKGRIVKCAKVKPTRALSYFYIEARNSGKNIRQKEAFFDNHVNKVMPFLLFFSLLSDSELDPCKTFLSGTFWGKMATGSWIGHVLFTFGGM